MSARSRPWTATVVQTWCHRTVSYLQIQIKTVCLFSLVDRNPPPVVYHTNPHFCFINMFAVILVINVFYCRSNHFFHPLQKNVYKLMVMRKNADSARARTILSGIIKSAPNWHGTAVQARRRQRGKKMSPPHPPEHQTKTFCFIQVVMIFLFFYGL